MPGFKRRLSSTSIATKRHSPEEDDENGQLERLEGNSRRRVRFRRSVQLENQELGSRKMRPMAQYSDHSNRDSPDFLERTSGASEVDESGGYSLEVEEPEKVLQANARACSCKLAASECCYEDHHHHHYPTNHQSRGQHGLHDSLSHSRAPVIIIPPVTDESTRFNCQNCSFLSGWFCCVPLLVIAVTVIVIVVLIMKSRMESAAKEASTSLESYQSTSPMTVYAKRLSSPGLQGELAGPSSAGTISNIWFRALG